MKKILVVEDEKPIRSAIVDKLRREGHEVEEASDGMEGLEKALSIKPDMVVLDIVMPRKTGIQMLQELRKDEWGETAKVVVLTNSSDPTHLADVLATNTHKYLVKTDWKLQDLLEKILEEVS